MRRSSNSQDVPAGRATTLHLDGLTTTALRQELRSFAREDLALALAELKVEVISELTLLLRRTDSEQRHLGQRQNALPRSASGDLAGRRTSIRLNALVEHWDAHSRMQQAGTETMAQLASEEEEPVQGVTSYLHYGTDKDFGEERGADPHKEDEGLHEWSTRHFRMNRIKMGVRAGGAFQSNSSFSAVSDTSKSSSKPRLTRANANVRLSDVVRASANTVPIESYFSQTTDRGDEDREMTEPPVEISGEVNEGTPYQPDNPQADDPDRFGPKVYALQTPRPGMLVAERTESRAPLLGGLGYQSIDTEQSRPYDGGSDDAGSDVGPRGSRSLQGWRAQITSMVRRPAFDMFFAMVVVMSALALGAETDYEARHPHQALPTCFSIFNAFLCVTFGIELSIRLLAEGWHFFANRNWMWNWFDFGLVLMQIPEEAYNIWVYAQHARNDSDFLRMVRLLRTGGRLVRMIRVLRLMRLLHELRMLCTSIISSMKSLGWALVLLCTLIYVVSVFFTEVVALCVHQSQTCPESQEWFGTVGRSALTLFEAIMGGTSWDAAVVPLMRDIGPIAAIAFCLYVAFCVLAVLNVVTGVFVGKATQAAQDEKDENLVNSIGDLFLAGGAQDDHITFKEFSSKLTHQDMQEYFKDLNVDVSEAKGLFQLLDVDGSGSVDSEEIVSGCLRLRGEAKAIELALLMQETKALYQLVENLSGNMTSVERHLMAIHKALRVR